VERVVPESLMAAKAMAAVVPVAATG